MFLSSGNPFVVQRGSWKKARTGSIWPAGLDVGGTPTAGIDIYSKCEYSLCEQTVSTRRTVKLHFEYAILGALMRGSMHGYDLHKLLSSSLGAVWHVGMSNMYGILKKLESEGHVRSTRHVQGNRPAKRVFIITEKGRRFFGDWISRPVASIRGMRVEFMAKLYFSKELGLSGGEKLIARQKEVCQDILASIEHPPIDDAAFAQLLVHFRGYQIQSILLWLDECLVFLKGSPGRD
jgi:DNA-binding PadR family transcriptional regulator